MIGKEHHMQWFGQKIRILVRHTLLAGLPALLLGTALPAHADGWRVCAQEGQTCQVDGRGVVRYGVEGQWSSRVLSGAVACNNDLFGDPAPRVPKRCEVRDSSGGGGSSVGWVFCAPEGETCHLRGSAEVRFGTDRHFNTRRAFGSVRCDVEAFGDPIYGQTKHCEVPASAALSGSAPQDAWAGSGNYGDSGRWRYCAGEGQVCHVQGRAEIRFGDGQRFATRSVRGDVLCNTALFGDPVRGVVKHCEVRAASFGGWGDSGPQDGGWTRCADEGDRCEVSGGRIQVRFGIRGRYVYRDVYGGLDCDVRTFGNDPYPGERKQCESRR
jgi:hypothetical protein